MTIGAGVLVLDGMLLAVARDEIVEGDQVLLQPLVIGTAGGKLLRDLLVVHHGAARGIDAKDLAGADAALLDHAALVVSDRTALAGTDHDPVVEHDIARRAQAVAIHDGAHDAAVGVGHGGGAVPGLHEAAVIFIKGPALGRHFAFGHAFPGLGHHHHQAVADIAAAADQQFQGIVKLAAVAAFAGDDGAQLGLRIVPEWALQVRLARRASSFRCPAGC